MIDATGPIIILIWTSGVTFSFSLGLHLEPQTKSGVDPRWGRDGDGCVTPLVYFFYCCLYGKAKMAHSKMSMKFNDLLILYLSVCWFSYQNSALTPNR